MVRERTSGRADHDPKLICYRRDGAAAEVSVISINSRKPQFGAGCPTYALKHEGETASVCTTPQQELPPCQSGLPEVSAGDVKEGLLLMSVSLFEF
jgi:hypothetical protein